MSLYVRVKTWATEILTRADVQAEIDAAAVALRNLEDVNVAGAIPRSMFEEDGGRGLWTESWCPMTADGRAGRPHHGAGTYPDADADIAHGMGTLSHLPIGAAGSAWIFPGSTGRWPTYLASGVVDTSTTPRTVEFPPWRPLQQVRLESGRVRLGFYRTGANSGVPLAKDGTLDRLEFDIVALPVDWLLTATRAELDEALVDPENSILTAPLEFPEIQKAFDAVAGNALVGWGTLLAVDVVNIGVRSGTAFRKADVNRDTRLFPVVRWKVTCLAVVGCLQAIEYGVHSCSWALNYTTEHIGAGGVVP